MIFSDNYCEADVYSLVHQKKLHTASRFPWRYTGLCNGKYLPVLDSAVAQNLNKYILYHHYIKSSDSEPLKNEYKFITINHNDGNIISYETGSAVRLQVALGEGNLGHFCTETESVELLPSMRELISYVPSEKNYTSCYLNGFTYDAEGEYTGVTFRRAHQGKNIANVSENAADRDERIAKHHEEWKTYTFPEENSFLTRLQNTITRNGGCYNPSLVRDVDGKLHYRLNYVRQEYFMKKNFVEGTPITLESLNPINSLKDRFEITNAQNSEMLLKILAANDLLSESELGYVGTIIEDCMAVINDIETHYIKDFRLAFEYVFKDNQLVDILMTRYQYWEFNEIEVPLYTEQRMIDLGISEEKIRSIYPD